MFITIVDESGETWLLNGTDYAQGISIAKDCSGHYGSPYSNEWTIAVTDAGDWTMQVDTSADRYAMVDTVNDNQWRLGKDASMGTMVFYKKVTE